MSSPEGKREYFYDRAGRLVSEKLNGEIDVEYKYGYLDKVIEVNRKGRSTLDIPIEQNLNLQMK